MSWLPFLKNPTFYSAVCIFIILGIEVLKRLRYEKLDHIQTHDIAKDALSNTFWVIQFLIAFFFISQITLAYINKKKLYESCSIDTKINEYKSKLNQVKEYVTKTYPPDDIKVKEIMFCNTMENTKIYNCESREAVYYRAENELNQLIKKYNLNYE